MGLGSVACVSVHRLSVDMYVSVTRQSQSMDTTVCLVALARVSILDSTKSTTCCVVPLSAHFTMATQQLVNRIPCARTRDNK